MESVVSPPTQEIRVSHAEEGRKGEGIQSVPNELNSQETPIKLSSMTVTGYA